MRSSRLSLFCQMQCSTSCIGASAIEMRFARRNWKFLHRMESRLSRPRRCSSCWSKRTRVWQSTPLTVNLHAVACVLHVLSQEFSKLCQDATKRNPDATAFFYLRTTVEDWIVELWVADLQAFSPGHLSALEHDIPWFSMYSGTLINIDHSQAIYWDLMIIAIRFLQPFDGPTKPLLNPNIMGANHWS